MLIRLNRAKQDFFRRIKNGEKPGYPRFKSRHRYRCIEIPGPRPGMVRQEKIGKVYIRIKGLPVLRLKPNRELPPCKNLKTIHIVRRPNGYYLDLIY